jgi:heme a synthase
VNSPAHNPWTHRLAAATMFVALLPIAIGTLVTTLQAGMAFLDWPTSDGHNMFLYDWLRDLREGHVKKFVEHGHRLAGIVIGCFGIALAGVAWGTRNRSSVRWLATAALLGIVAQGLLGGLRVIEDERLLALAHGQGAAIVFTLLAVTSLVSSRRWNAPDDRRVGSAHRAVDTGSSRERWAQPTLPLAIVTPLVLVMQYVLGGHVRHLGTALFEHVGLAVVALGLVIATSVTALLSGSAWLRRSGWAMLILVHVQVALGLSAFVAKYGFAPTGYVAVRGSALQLTTASLHTIVGLLLVAASVVHLVKVARRRVVERRFRSVAEAPAPGLAALNGGVS